MSNASLNLRELLSNVKPEFHLAFARFVDTGEADQDFLDYLDQDPQAQVAVEQAFRTQAAALEEFARTLDPA